jgi:protein O-GlcNAc transferase
MKIFNRFRSGGRAAEDVNNNSGTPDQAVLRLIDEGHAHEADGRIDEAMQCYLEAIRLAPQHARAHLNHGNALLAKGDLKGALDAFKTAIKLKPDYAGAYYNMGNALLGNRQMDEAASNYRRALEIEPGYAEVHCALGVALRDLGKFQDAAASCRRALELKPDMVEAHYNLGLALQGLGQLESATASYRRAVELNPNMVEAHKNLGYTLQLLGQLEGAVASYRRAVELNPDLFEMHNNIGLALQKLGQLEDAATSYHRAVKLRPDQAEAYINLGNTQKELGRFQDAAANYRRASEIMPDYADAHNNLGVVLHDLGHYEEALASYRHALGIKPDYAEAHCNLGATLKEQGNLAEAAASYRRALEIKPDLADAYSNLGVVLHDLGQQHEAVKNYRLALEINPDLAVAHNNLGSALKEQGKFTEADASYKRALEIEPDNAIFRVALLFNLPIAPPTVADSEEVPENFDRSLKKLSDWMLSAPAQRKQISEALVLQGTFYLAYRYGNHVSLLSRFGDMIATNSAQNRFKHIPKRDKPRFVVVSNHFRRHSVWDVILRGLLVNLDRTRFEVVLYNTSNEVDGETRLAKSLADAWRDFRTVAGLDGWLEAMAADQPDVIFYPEIGMDRTTLSLATRRLAPLQVAGWGHPITTGLPTIDMYFSGELLEPPDADKHYREKLVRLPGTGCCTAPIDLKPQELHQLSADLAKRRGPRFVIAQSPFKFDPADDALFARIAVAVGECTFILISDLKLPWAMDRLIDRLNRTFIERNLDPERYLLVIPWLPREKFYTLLDISDIFLDCPSFSGYTTAWQAVQRGLPVLTLEGKYMRQRLAAGLLRKIGVTDTIAVSADDYVAIAVRLAAECRDPEHRDARRRSLRAAAPLADNDISVVRMFEQSLIEALAERELHFEFDTAITCHPTPDTGKASNEPNVHIDKLNVPILDNNTGSAAQKVLFTEDRPKQIMISIIFCTINKTKAQAMEQHYRNLLGNEPYEIIVICDARSLAEAYNRGIDRAIGDILIFSHDDIEFLDPSTWLTRLRAHLANFDIIGLAGTTRLTSSAWAQAGPPYTFGQVAELGGSNGPFQVLLCSVPASVVPGIQGLDGLFFAVKRQVVQRVRFDEKTFDGFHCYDTDFTFRAYLAGFKIAVATDLSVLHASQGRFDEKWELYAQRFMDKHSAWLAHVPLRQFQHAFVVAQTKKEILEIMAPPQP